MLYNFVGEMPSKEDDMGQVLGLGEMKDLTKVVGLMVRWDTVCAPVSYSKCLRSRAFCYSTRPARIKTRR